MHRDRQQNLSTVLHRIVYMYFIEKFSQIQTHVFPCTNIQRYTNRKMHRSTYADQNLFEVCRLLKKAVMHRRDTAGTQRQATT